MFHFLHNVWPFSYLFYKKVKPATTQTIIPTFYPPDSLKNEEYVYNPEFYATEDCAESVMRKFNAQVRYLKPIDDAGRLAPPQWFVRFPDGAEVNAGQIAKLFVVYPESESHIAVNLAIQLIAMIRAENKNEGYDAAN